MQKTTLSQKIMLLVFGLLLAGVILEISLHFAQKLYFVAQDYRNTRVRHRGNQNAKRVYKILCLGESTTALGQENSYPRQLERILHQDGRTKFVVINKGVPATTTDQILGRLESYLDEYRPDFVVAMMGVNDTALTPVYKNDLDQKKGLIEVKLKSVKFLRFLVQHLQVRWREIRENLMKNKILRAAQTQVRAAPSQEGYFELAVKGARGEALDWQRSDDSPKVSYYLTATVANYRQLKEKVTNYGLVLIAVEYPMRSVESLKKVFALGSNVLFVDNETSFKKAVAQSGYAQYFVDHFAGDFGHGTVEGNALLANQVAAVVRGAL